LPSKRETPKGPSGPTNLSRGTIFHGLAAAWGFDRGSTLGDLAVGNKELRGRFGALAGAVALLLTFTTLLRVWAILFEVA